MLKTEMVDRVECGVTFRAIRKPHPLTGLPPHWVSVSGGVVMVFPPKSGENSWFAYMPLTAQWVEVYSDLAEERVFSFAAGLARQPS